MSRGQMQATKLHYVTKGTHTSAAGQASGRGLQLQHDVCGHKALLVMGLQVLSAQCEGRAVC